MSNPYDKEIEAGDRLTFTYEMSLHLAALGIDHNFDYGDEMLVLGRDDRRHFPVLIGDPHDIAFQAWVFLTITEDAHTFHLKMQELEPEGEGVSSPLPLSYWNQHYHSLSPDERNRLWQALEDSETVWRLLTSNPTLNSPFSESDNPTGEV